MGCVWNFIYLFISLPSFPQFMISESVLSIFQQKYKTWCHALCLLQAKGWIEERWDNKLKPIEKCLLVSKTWEVSTRGPEHRIYSRISHSASGHSEFRNLGTSEQNQIKVIVLSSWNVEARETNEQKAREQSLTLKKEMWKAGRVSGTSAGSRALSW